jgi:hypothetical protein
MDYTYDHLLRSRLKSLNEKGFYTDLQINEKDN